jgi:lipid-binding SYLF domain-containing protein
VALGVQLVRHERLTWARVGAQVPRPAASAVCKQSDSTAVRPGLDAVSPLATQTLASAVTPVQLVASAAAKQCAVLTARARLPEAAMAEGTMAGAKLAGAKIPEVAMAAAKMLAARLAAPTAAKMLAARMAAPAAAVPECNLLAEARRS